MSLNQFGAVLTFAIDLEKQLAEFYTQAADSDSNGSEFSQRAAGAQKRRQKIEQARRQNVTEITLEPIEGLEASDYALDTSSSSPAAVNQIEATVSRFYQDAAPKINVREARQVMERCLKEHQNLKPL
jgi:hypothetical protein